MTADHDFVVPARRWAEIGGIADNVRHRLGLWDDRKRRFQPIELMCS